jgi:inhibitor of cysteine peptidase
MEVRVQPPTGGRSVRVGPDDVIVIQLPESPTTGYRWDIDRLDEHLLGVEESTFSGPSGPAVGAGGTREIRIRPKGAGRGSIHLKNARVWGSPDAAIDRFDLSVEVTGQAD